MTPVLVFFQVVLYDVSKAQLDGVLGRIAQQMVDFEKQGVLRGSISREEQLKNISVSSNLEECLKVIKIWFLPGFSMF